MGGTKDELVKLAIVDAAAKLFQHYGLNKTTMDDIAKALGKSKGSLYYYYSTKEEIFEAVIQSEKDVVFEYIKSAVAKVESAEDKFRVFATTKYNEIKKRMILHKIIFDEIEDNPCLFQIIRNKYDVRELEIVRDIIEYGVRSGAFDVADTRNLEAVAMICAITLRGIQMDFIFDDKKECEAGADLLDISVNMLLKSIRKA